MTQLGALLWKEWRDHRAEIGVFAGLIAFATAAVQHWICKYNEPAWTSEALVPGSVALALAFVAADLFAMDVATGRLASMAALPVPIRRHWKARALFLALVGVAFTVWTYGVTLGTIALFGRHGALAEHVDAVGKCSSGFAIVAVNTACVLLFSSFGVGGFRAVVFSLPVAALMCVASWYVVEIRHLAYYDDAWHMGLFDAARVIAAAVVVSASYLGFVRGRGHAVSRRRGLAWALALLLIALVPIGADAAWRAGYVTTIDLDDVRNDPKCELQCWSTSPDGRYVAVTIQKSPAMRAWIARIEDGRIFDWPGRRSWAYDWTKDGSVWMIGGANGVFAKPETGEIVRANPTMDEIRVAAPNALQPGPAWGGWLKIELHGSTRGSSTWRLFTRDGLLSREVKSVCMPSPTLSIGQALLASEDHALSVIDLATGTQRVVIPKGVKGTSGWIGPSPSGRHCVVLMEEGPAVYDTSTWTLAAGPWKGCSVLWCASWNDADVVTIAGPGDDPDVHELFDFADSREIAIDRNLAVRCTYGAVERLPDGRFVACQAQKRVVLLDKDGRLERVLFPPKED